MSDTMLLKSKEFKKNKNISKFLLTSIYELVYTRPCKKLRPDVFNNASGVFVFSCVFVCVLSQPSFHLKPH